MTLKEIFYDIANNQEAYKKYSIFELLEMVKNSLTDEQKLAMKKSFDSIEPVLPITSIKD